MIPVSAAREPETFDAKVRQPGLAAMAELVGEPTGRTRTGPKRKAQYASREEIPSGGFFPYWTEALPDLREHYHNVCAYLALYLEGPGGGSVDHAVPKTKDWRLAYEWTNYRLCHPLINATKGNRLVPLDPFAIEAGLFALELTEYQVIPGPRAAGEMIGVVESACVTLGLNLRDCRQAREEYVRDYRLGPPVGISLHRLERRAPFVAQELRRQGQLNPGDV